MSTRLRDLQRSFANTLKPLLFVSWIDAVSDFIDTASGGTTAGETKFVEKTGNDTTGDGSILNPFLTVAAAIASISDASSTKPYLVKVGPGVFDDTFTLKPFVYVSGSGSGNSQYDGAPLVAVTTLAPNATNVLTNAFTGSSSKPTGISNCALSTALVADFADVGSAGEGTISLVNILTEHPVSVTGSATNNLNTLTLFDLVINNDLNTHLTITNIGQSDVNGYVNDFTGKIKYIHSASFEAFHLLGGSNCGGIELTWTGADPSKVCHVNTAGNVTSEHYPIISGVGANLLSPSWFTVVMADADKILSFGAGGSVAPDYIGISLGQNIVHANPTAPRTLTIDRPGGSAATTILVRNISTTAGANIKFNLPSGNIAPGSPTYCPPSSEVRLIYDAFFNYWYVQPIVQSGSVALTNGVSAAIPADITALSSIVASLKTFSGAAGSPQITNITPGTVAAGTGSFKITSVNLATGATVATDQGTYNWLVK